MRPSSNWRGEAVQAPVRDRVLLVIQRTAARSVTPRDDQHLHNDLGMDEQMRMELFMALELQFRIEGLDFSSDEIADFSTVGALIDLVERKLEERRAEA